MKKTINLSLESNTYQEIKERIPSRQISPLVNNLLKDYLKKQKNQELDAAYQDFTKNKKLQKELET
jgi:hypothetical protein